MTWRTWTVLVLLSTALILGGCEESTSPTQPVEYSGIPEEFDATGEWQGFLREATPHEGTQDVVLTLAQFEDAWYGGVRVVGRLCIAGVTIFAKGAYTNEDRIRITYYSQNYAVRSTITVLEASARHLAGTYESRDYQSEELLASGHWRVERSLTEVPQGPFPENIVSIWIGRWTRGCDIEGDPRLVFMLEREQTEVTGYLWSECHGAIHQVHYGSWVDGDLEIRFRSRNIERTLIGSLEGRTLSGSSELRYISSGDVYPGSSWHATLAWGELEPDHDGVQSPHRSVTTAPGSSAR